MSYRLLLRAYPQWFRDEFGGELTDYLARERAEPRYRKSPSGAVRFWWHVVIDAVLTGVTLRLVRARERWSGFWDALLYGRPAGGANGRDGAGLATLLGVLTRDVRHALRTLLAAPGYALVFILTLGLGIGANTAIFSAVNGVLLRPLPHEDGDRLVYLRHVTRFPVTDNALFSVPEIDDYRDGSPSLGAIAEFSAMTFTMLGQETPRRVRAGIVSGNYFDVMGLSALLGRTVGREDDGADAPAVVVLSDRYWRSAFGSDRGILGRSLEISGRRATIVGVAEPAPPYPERTDIYVNMATSPHHLDATMSDDRDHRMTEVFARLAPAATVASARAEVAAVTSRLHEQFAESYDAKIGYDVTVTPLKTQLTRRARPTLLLLLTTAFLVLIIACANLANLALTRVLRRDHELAIRISLGASRATLRRELLIENLVLAMAGAALALLIAFASLDLIIMYAERFTARASEIALDAAVFRFAMIAAVFAAVFFTIVPALPDNHRVGGALRSGPRATVGTTVKRAQRALVVLQVATSFVLLIGAGLLVRTMLHLQGVDPGFDRTQILTMDVPDNAVPPSTGVEARNRYLGILDDVRVLPGVEGAALTGSVPLTQTGIPFLADVDVEHSQPRASPPRAGFQIVSAGYFTLLGIDLVHGREFVATDDEDAQKVVVINEAMTRDYFGARNPIGQRIAWRNELMARFMGIGPEWRTVVGVVADTRDRGLDADVVHTVYHPYPQVRLTGSLVLRVTGDPTAILPAVRTVILARDPKQPIENVATLEDLSSRSVAPRRLNTMLLTGFALLALVIAAVGIGGVLAYSVGSRTREFGVRGALGAARYQIWSGVLAEGAVMAAIGVALGSIGAAALARLMAGLLVGVPPLDPVTFVAVGLLLLAVAISAAWAPAWRAARVNPMEAMASE